MLRQKNVLKNFMDEKLEQIQKYEKALDSINDKIDEVK